MLHYSHILSSPRRVKYGFNSQLNLQIVLLTRGYVASSLRQKKYEITTLRPDRLVSTNQQVLDLSGGTARRVHFEGYGDESKIKPSGSVSIHYQTVQPTERLVDRFPPNTRGVFYYSEDSQIRFRLCENVDDFGKGTDLQRGDGHTWNISFARMVENPLKYGAVLALLKKETSIQVDPSCDRHRAVSTFSRERLMSSSHRIVDISGHGVVSILPGSEEDVANLAYFKTQETGTQAVVSFPPNTKGVLYYRQSKTSPMRLGELRFRLCSDSRAFEEGNDLCLPSGDPWFASSHSLSTSKKYRSLRSHLIKERLLTTDLYAGIPESILDSLYNPVLNLGQPIVIELSWKSLTLNLLTRHPPWIPKKVIVKNFLRNQLNPSFSGRAIVCLEQYPATALRPGHRRQPLFAMRFLEAITPIQLLATDGRPLKPVCGEFLSISDNRLGYVPWGYSPTTAATRNMVGDWMGQQNSKPVVTLDH